MSLRFMLCLHYNMYKCSVLFMTGNGGIYVVKLNAFKTHELFRLSDLTGHWTEEGRQLLLLGGLNLGQFVPGARKLGLSKRFDLVPGCLRILKMVEEYTTITGMMESMENHGLNRQLFYYW